MWYNDGMVHYPAEYEDDDPTDDQRELLIKLRGLVLDLCTAEFFDDWIGPVCREPECILPMAIDFLELVKAGKMQVP